MRYITIQFYRSMQFYHAIAKPDKNYNEFINRFNQDKTAIQDYFHHIIQQHFHDDIIEADSIKKLVFSHDTTINYINCSIYEDLQIFSEKFMLYMEQTFDEVYKTAEYIRQNNYSEYMSKLASLRLHDAKILSIKICDNVLKMTIAQYNRQLSYIFEVPNSLSINDFKQFTGNIIFYEELFINGVDINGVDIYEYNILVGGKENTTKYLHSNLRELSVIFQQFRIE